MDNVGNFLYNSRNLQLALQEYNFFLNLIFYGYLSRKGNKKGFNLILLFTDRLIRLNSGAFMLSTKVTQMSIRFHA